MDKTTIERANTLQRQIEWLKTMINGDIGLHWARFVVEFHVNFGPSMGDLVYHGLNRGLDVGELFDVEEKIKDILREVMNRKQKELDSL